MCGPHRHFAPLRPHTLQRIPQTVGVVATYPVGGGVLINYVEFQYRKR